MTMREASVEAQNFANGLNAVKVAEEELEAKIKTTTDQYAYNQKMVELSSIAQNKSLGNVKSILNEYNSEMAETGLKQEDFIKSVSQSNPVLGKYLSNVETGKAKMSGYVGSLIAAKAATIGLQLATTALNAVISMGIGWAISSFIGMISEAINSANELRDSIIDTAKEATDHIKELESSMKSYLELDTTATEADKVSALKSVTEQINNKSEALKNATEAEKGYKDAVMDSIKADYDDAAVKANSAAVAAKEKIAGQWSTDYTRTSSNTKESESVYNEIKGILGDYIETRRSPRGINRYLIGQTIDGLGRYVPTIDTNDAESLLVYYEKLEQAQTAIQQKALELGDSGNALLESPLYKAISEILNNETNKTNIQDYITNRSEQIYNSAIAKNGIPETVGQFNTLKETMLDEAKGSTLLADAITNRLNGTFGSLAEEAVKAEHSVSTLDFTITDEELEGQIEGLQDSLSKIADNYKKISGVIDDYNANGSLSIDNLETLISVGDEYISTLFDENGKLNLNKESYAKLAKAKLEDIRYSMLENAISSLNQLSKDDETSANNELAESTGNLTEETLKLVAAKKLAEGVSGEKIQNVLRTYSEWSALIDNTEAGLENNIDATLGLSNASNTLKDSLENEKKALENSKSALEEQKSALEDTKDGYENAIESIKSLIDWTENYIKQTKEDEIDALEKKKQSVDDLIESQKELLQAQKDEYNWNKEISDKQNSVAKNALSVSVASLDDSSAGKKAYKEAIDTLNESRSDMTDTLYEHSIDTRMEALDKLKEQSDEYYDGEIDKINEFLNDEVALYKAACSMIDNDNGTLYSNLLNYCKTYTTTSESEFNHMWTSAQSAMQQYNIANLDTFSLLNDLQGRIYEVDTAIDAVASGIQSYEDKISGVQSKLDNLSNSAQTAINNINAAIEASNNLGNNNKKINTTSFWVNYKGKKYQTGYNYSGDTNSNRLLAANELTKLIAKDVSGFDQYGLGIVQGLLGVKFESNSSNTSSTNKSPYIFDVPKFKFPHYAKGTRNSVGGLSITQEDGFEAIFQKLQNGEYTMMPKSSQVFNSDMTDNLYNFSADPQKFMSELASKFNYSNYLDSRQGDIDRVIKQVASNYNQNNMGDITVNSAPVYIQGDATQSTVNALKKERDKLRDDIVNDLIKYRERKRRATIR